MSSLRLVWPIRSVPASEGKGGDPSTLANETVGGASQVRTLRLDVSGEKDRGDSVGRLTADDMDWGTA